jgi:RimJ/RimL family protein N-acetyltransferase
VARIVYVSNDVISLVEYQPCDDRALYESWLDPDVQKGFNGIYVASFEEFATRDKHTRFTAMIRFDQTGEIIGTVGISSPEEIADLTIRIFEPYRKQGYGTAAFALATNYIINELKISELHAGAFPDNVGSRKMLKKCGYIPYPAGNISEKHYITGEAIVQLDYIYKPINIRLAVPADAPEMAEVLMRSWEVAYKDIIPADYIRQKNATRPEQYKRVITEENTTDYVIQLKNKTVGIMRITPPQDDDLGDEYYDSQVLYLHPDYFHQGIGSQAAEFAYEIARGLGKTGMTVWVLAENINSIRFYEKCGFVPDGKAKERDYGKILKIIRMRRAL